MPLTAEEVLKKLLAATDEAKETTRALHEARGAALDVIKKQKHEIAEIIQTTVEAAFAELSEDAKMKMVDGIDAVIKGIEHDWREKLGLI